MSSLNGTHECSFNPFCAYDSIDCKLKRTVTLLFNHSVGHRRSSNNIESKTMYRGHQIHNLTIDFEEFLYKHFFTEKKKMNMEET